MKENRIEQSKEKETLKKHYIESVKVLKTR